VHGTSGTLTLGTMGPLSMVITEIQDLFRARHPTAQVLHREIQPPSPLDLLRSDEVDVALLWQPIREPDLSVGAIDHTSTVLLMVAAGHPYAGRDSICLEDLGDHCAQVSPQSIPSYMEAAVAPFHTPAGRPIGRGPSVSTWQEVLSTVASGEATAVVVDEVPRYYPWPTLAFVPIRDAAPLHWALVWRTAAETPLIRAFVQAARDATAGP
jgi:DNA-binding transcriptional LysR family regulator